MATLCVSLNSARMAAATSKSLTCTVWSRCGARMASASGSAMRQAMPSGNRVDTGASTTWPAAIREASIEPPAPLLNRMSAWTWSSFSTFARGALAPAFSISA